MTSRSSLSLDYSLFFDFSTCSRKIKKIVRYDFVNHMSWFLEDVLKVPREASLAICNATFCRMSDKRLHYHTPVHVLAILEFFDKNVLCKGDPSLSEAEELAVWFHDSIYVPGAKPSENELHNADFMHAMLKPFMHGNSQILRDAYAHIMNTSRHDVSMVPEASHRIMDLDLCSFAFDYTSYCYVGECIRKEYPHVSDDVFAMNRSSFLKKLNEKGYLFRTQGFREFEAMAQKNCRKTLP